MASKILANLKFSNRSRLQLLKKFRPVGNCACSESNFSLHSIDRREKSNQSENAEQRTNKNSLVVAGLTGLSLYLLLNENEKVDLSKWIIPVVKAEQKLPSDEASLRKRFNFIADVVDKSAGSVVYIETVGRKDFFQGGSARNGSGFIVKEDGIILTNAHVVIGRPKSVVQVKLKDGRTFSGYVEDVDIKSDLATVKIKANNLPVMKLGSSSDIRPGEWVVAIGSPLSLSNTITAGIVSSPHRESKELGLWNKDINYIQTDASITFGNSGGPLVNLDGEAIGINTMRMTTGISFAIPIDHAKEFLKKSDENRRLKSSKAPNRTYLGVAMLSLTPDLLQELHSSSYRIPHNVTSGVLIFSVDYGSPAHMGGLMPGDIITKINTRDVQHSNQVMENLEAGGRLAMRVIRGNYALDLYVTPENLE